MAKIKDALILAVITLIAGLALGGVYEITKEPIAQQKLAANARAYMAVCPGAAEFKNEDSLTKMVVNAGQLLEGSGLEMGNVAVDEALYAYDDSGAVSGMVVKTTSKDGYGGNISVVVGIQSQGEEITVTGIDYLAINETAGLGMKATEPEFMDQFKNKTVESFELVKGGASEENQIDALSGATYTSGAVTGAVNAAVCFARAAAQQQ